MRLRLLATIVAAVVCVTSPPAVPASADTGVTGSGEARPQSAPAPLISDTPEEAVTASGARRMKTVATYYPDQHRVTAFTTTRNAVKLAGFTGAVAVLFLDRDNRIIGSTQVRTFGVDGAWIFTGRSERKDYWDETLSGSWLDQVASIQAVHSRIDQVRLHSIIGYAVSSLKPLADLVAELVKLKPKE
jgi:hypothetical protein